jgi:hypothetical protein
MELKVQNKACNYTAVAAAAVQLYSSNEGRYKTVTKLCNHKATQYFSDDEFKRNSHI